MNTLDKSPGQIQALRSPSLMSVFKAGRCPAPLGLPMEQVTGGPSKLQTAHVRPGQLYPLPALLTITAFSLWLTHSLSPVQRPETGSPGHISRLNLILQGINGQYSSVCYCKENRGHQIVSHGKGVRDLQTTHDFPQCSYISSLLGSFGG